MGGVNGTMQKFGYPDSLVAEYDNWVVLLRPQQPTLGALVLACRENATAFSDISPAAFQELPDAVGDIEKALGEAVRYEKINYLMLMMVDPEVHFHVIPRYSEAREFKGVSFPDAGWPAVPALGEAPELDAEQLADLRDFIAAKWPEAG